MFDAANNSPDVLFCGPKNKVSPNSYPAGFQFLNLARCGSGRIKNRPSQIRYNPNENLGKNINSGNNFGKILETSWEIFLSVNDKRIQGLP